MRYLTCLVLVAAATVSMNTTAISASGDSPVSSNGTRGPTPSAEGDASIAPSRGTGSTDVNEILARGAKIAPSTPFPPNGLDTVAYGSFGKPKPAESVINWDSRTRSYTTTYPTRAIVFIELNGAHLCTGWMYSARDVVTAGHCVHTGGSAGAWRDKTKMKIYAGRDGTISPYGFCTVKRLASVTGWTVSNNFRYDYGHMRLNCNVGNTVGWFGMYAPASPVGMPAIIGGYPGDKPRTNWTSADKIRTVTAEMIAYRMDTAGGHSGSPIWHDKDEGLSTSSNAWAFGIHNYGVGAVGTTSNSAARLTAARITNYTNWKNAP